MSAIRSRICSICFLLFIPIASVTAQQSIEDEIGQVESGLSGVVKLKDDEDWTIQQRMEHYGVPGVCIAVVRDRKVVWTKAYGVKDRDTDDAVTKETLFQCASISKPVAAAAALRLVEHGVFELESSVNDYLKSWQLPNNQFTKQKPVTLKHLVSHTGGVTTHGFLGYGEGLEVPSLAEVLDGCGPANSPPIRVDKLPGGSYRYSGGGYCVMQQMMIDAARKPFPEIMDDLVLKRLGMKKSTFVQPIPESRRAEVATGYLPSGEVVSGKQHTYPEMAPAGLYSTAEELAGFFVELQSAWQGTSEQILSTEMARKMMATDDEGTALGLAVRDRSGEVYFGHEGWNEGFSSEADFHRTRGYGAVVLTNSNHPPLVNEIFTAIARTYRWEHYYLPEFERLKIDAETMKQALGRYDQHGSLWTVFELDGKLMMTSNGAKAIELLRVGPNQFVSRSIGSLICFEHNEQQRAQFSFLKPWEDAPDPKNVAVQLGADELLPIEWIEKGNFEKALDGYRKLQSRNSGALIVSEDRIDSLGYMMLDNNQKEKAIGLFRANTILYPSSFEAQASLGEAYMIDGNRDLAIQAYEKSLQLNPGNERARQKIKRIQSKAER